MASSRRLRVGDLVFYRNGNIDETHDRGLVIGYNPRRGGVVVLWLDDGAIDEASRTGWLWDLAPGRRTTFAVPTGHRWGAYRTAKAIEAIDAWFEADCPPDGVPRV